ncbi:MAG TPA: hypothetical protein VJ201_07505, partial [Candidatus Babeliales bacterium]|nr:hypothetical protein [Candidatus Babeliales bacterium]
IVINATVTDNFDVDTVIFYNGTINQTYTVPFTATFVEGNHTIIFYANDTSGNVNQTEVSFFVDTTAPTISFVSPTTGTSNDSNVTINISTTGDDIDTVTLFNGTDNQTYTNEFSALFVDGEHTFIAYVNDTAGNNAQTSVTFTVDTTPAQVPLGVLVSILSIGLVIALLASLIGLKEVDNPVLKYSALVISTSIILVILFYGLNFF